MCLEESLSLMDANFFQACRVTILCYKGYKVHEKDLSLSLSFLGECKFYGSEQLGFADSPILKFLHEILRVEFFF